MPPTFAAPPGDMFCTVMLKSNLCHCCWQKTNEALPLMGRGAFIRPLKHLMIFHSCSLLLKWLLWN